MSKLKPLPTKKVIRILEKNGFKRERTGKHITFKKTLSSGKVLTTWVPKGKEVTVFVLQYIIKQTDIPREEFC
jgi:predicted RNA binding protein YcfA (HicA-like mRNA interferase family)